MQWLLRKLNKLLREEKLWLSREGLGSVDAKYREGARMARERIPQLERTIELIENVTETVPKPKPQKDVSNQLKIF